MRELDGPDKTDFLRAGEESNAMHVRSLFLQLSKHADNFRAAEQIVTSAGMNLTVLNLKAGRSHISKSPKDLFFGLLRNRGATEPRNRNSPSLSRTQPG